MTRGWQTMLLAMSAVSLIAAAGCGGDEEEESYTISDQPLQGTLDGEPWEVVSGFARLRSFGDEPEEYWVELWPEAHSCDEFFMSSERPSVLFTIAPERQMPGEYPLTLFGNNVTVAIPPPEGSNITENLVLFQGLLRLDEITATSITGGLYARGEGQEIDGNFDITICADETP